LAGYELGFGLVGFGFFGSDFDRAFSVYAAGQLIDQVAAAHAGATGTGFFLGLSQL
jgi:hypothetical protein